MKKIFIFLITCTIVLTGCDKNYSFKGVNYRFERNSGNSQKSAITHTFKSEKIIAQTNDEPVGYIGPYEAIVACSRIIFPSKDDAQALFDANEGQEYIIVSEEKLAEIMPNAIVAYNETTNNPKIITLDDAEVNYLDTLMIGDDERFWGMILKTVYFEFVMEDFRIRWYCNDCDPYKNKDVLIKRDSDTEWKFIYNKVNVDMDNPANNNITIHLSDTRCEDLFFWSKHDGGLNPRQDTLSHIAIEYIEDWSDEGGMVGSLNGRNIMDTFGKTSTEETGGGFGRLDNEIIGFSISVIYSLNDPGGSGTYGLMHNIETSENGKIKFSDIDKPTLEPKQLYPIKSLEFEVDYDIAD